MKNNDLVLKLLYPIFTIMDSYNLVFCENSRS